MRLSNAETTDHEHSQQCHDKRGGNMKYRAVLFTIAVITGLAVSAGVFGVISPFGFAKGTSRNDQVQRAEIDDILDELAPGAVVKKEADGSVSIFGTATPSVQAEVRRAKELADSGPNSIRCDGTGGMVVCAPVRDSEVVPALRAGEKTLYGRTVYRSITKEVTDRAAPIFEARELVCGNPGKNGTVVCSRVDHVQPVIPSGETLFVTYKPYNVTFERGGLPTMHSTRSTVPLVRAAP